VYLYLHAALSLKLKDIEMNGFRAYYKPIKVWLLLTVPSGVTFQDSSFFSQGAFCVLYGSQEKKTPRLFPNTALTDWFL
jgi:hypothetical protein